MNPTIPPISENGFCRDCMAYQASTRPRCQSCGSPRVTRHEELFDLSIAHIDCDAFYASVEKRDNPDLQNKPVIIGGGKRGVVSTCCYIARIHGVRSAMPMYLALKACPDAVVITPNMAKYVEVSREIRARMDALSPAVQPLSIDEAFLDLSGTQKLHGHPPAYVLARMAKECQEQVGITVSVGLSHNKFLAKIASDLDKPRGFSIIGASETVEFLAQQPLSKIWGVGKATREKLQKDGFFDVKALQEANQDDLMKRYGVLGQRLSQLSKGIDTRIVKREIGAKSVSKEITFNEDYSSGDILVPHLRRLSEQVSASLKEKDIAGYTVVLKLKTTEFKSRTRNRSLSDPTQLADRIFQEGRQLLEKELDGTKFRLLGIGVSNLCSPEQADPQNLVDDKANKRAAAEKAMDKVRDKFGSNAVKTGLTHKSKK